MVETYRAGVYCPAEVLQQEEDWGRGRQLRRKQFIWSMRNSWGGRSAPLLSKAKWDVRKGCLSPAPCFPAASESSPASSPGSSVSHLQSSSPAQGCPSQWDAPPDVGLYLLLNIQHCTVLYYLACETGVCSISHRWQQRNHK